MTGDVQIATVLPAIVTNNVIERGTKFEQHLQEEEGRRKSGSGSWRRQESKTAD